MQPENRREKSGWDGKNAADLRTREPAPNGHLPESGVRGAAQNPPETGNLSADPILHRRPRNSGESVQKQPDFEQNRRPRPISGGPCSKAEIRETFRSKSRGKFCSVDLHYKSGVGIQIFPAEKKPGFCALGREGNCAFEFPRAHCKTPRRKQLTQKSSPRSKNPAGFCTI